MTQQPYHRQNLAAAIVQRARQELEEAGGDRLSLRQIARFLEVTPAAVYRHYPDKAALLTQLRRDIVEELTAALHAGVLDSADATAMLQRMVTNLLAYAAAHPHAVAFIVVTPPPVPQSLQTVVTLLAAQRQTVATPQTTTAMWTFLLGVLLQRDTTFDATWISEQLLKLLAE
ncbi:TetR/AcrR family transcriptional regulator [Levilactobacillus tujiorum]|uniref:TetR/AcrR family transcriptional regulator n=1 Tax=Levilactobacillus tujiorum TaxID=2912243 RepID=A0ABX1L6F8_9LACO|nr:TetR/AcrR family transcriptional regulator [Levilactobacillus tujiorum]MCH5463698.1 TetR/AcrR family transcriptional regulator [Levilactobacillus tujiorum]NLR10904.1 TetR/AcrR family transcriptional regulator [Lactobacillus sp. HBUAS51387]NLR28685.1 TetR/AcrR family transcriptional regulator [Levilactobacillus tujiorum]